MTDIIDLIDGAILDEGLEGAMRWTPEPEAPVVEDRPPVPPGHCRIYNVEDGIVLYEGPYVMG